MTEYTSTRTEYRLHGLLDASNRPLPGAGDELADYDIVYLRDEMSGNELIGRGFGLHSTLVDLLNEGDLATIDCMLASKRRCVLILDIASELELAESLLRH